MLPTCLEETLLYSPLFRLFSFRLLSHSLTFPSSFAFCPFIVFDISCLTASVCWPCSQQQIMRDRWMNVGYEEEELKPYIEPQPDYKDPRRTGKRRNILKNDKCIPFFSHTQTYLSTDVVFLCSHKRIIYLKENYGPAGSSQF